ncbi:hypothetical protein HNY73_011471 [Argiope bruennichi]|uniref:Uncharacterized protein n=1 Tax=Argiope bruennichi TaxID=94029 RepID=A0A8T0F570_ARGBR|nr:hypothetical protein HNY73_011471 [Argiope bruennichi]
MSPYATPSTSPADGSSVPTRSISEANGRRETLGARSCVRLLKYGKDKRVVFFRLRTRSYMGALAGWILATLFNTLDKDDDQTESSIFHNGKLSFQVFLQIPSPLWPAGSVRTACSMSPYATPSTSPADGSSVPTRSISEANGRRETLGARVCELRS